MTAAKRGRLLVEADSLARERAGTWQVFVQRKSGTRINRFVKAKSEQQALRKARGSYQARPVLPTSQWDEIYAAVGLR